MGAWQTKSNQRTGGEVMSVTNPAPSQIASTDWSIESGIRSFTVSIPARPVDNDLAGIIVLAKAGTGQTLTFPDDVFYRGSWSDLILISTDASNNVLLPNQAYTVKVAAYDEFGTDLLTFSDAKETTTLRVVTDDIEDEAVTNGKIPDDEIQSAKISGLVADKIEAGTITGSTLQTASSDKRFVVSTTDNEAHFYGDRGDGTVVDLCNIGINPLGLDNTIVNIGDADSRHIGINISTQGPYSIKSTMTASRPINSSLWSEITCVTSGSFPAFVAGVYSKLTTDNHPAWPANYRTAGNFAVESGKGIAVRADHTSGKGNGSIDAWALRTNGDVDMRGSIVYFSSHTVSTLPSASIAGGIIYVSDESGGAIMAFSDGSNWRRMSDRAIVS